MNIKSLSAGLALGALTAFGANADQITVFDWSGYDDPGFFNAYVEKHGGAPDFSFLRMTTRASTSCVPIPKASWLKACSVSACPTRWLRKC
ncbi:hypothetical protein [Ruegeria atlantica]|uniref:hypothetical protein n=1 Tax=Ruegeria atlantica TaxID=81569 RepID=UPI00148181C5|nr:hypothetical protein [Ruegeria atlantica]